MVLPCFLLAFAPWTLQQNIETTIFCPVTLGTKASADVVTVDGIFNGHLVNFTNDDTQRW
jgi:hypothetical protein